MIEKKKYEQEGEVEKNKKRDGKKIKRRDGKKIRRRGREMEKKS